MEIRTRENDFQEKFLFSQKKFPAVISGIGTGKTLILLTKIFSYCENYPKTNALIVRKEFTDLRDSTLRDFETYFEVTVGSDKNYTLSNGSTIMFRHAAEIQVLKNINLGIAGIEQAEEFEDDTQFQFIRDRMRQNNGATVRPICVIANANGHNWVWKLWINQAESVNTLDADTGEYEYLREEYHCLTANSFANERNLPPDFIKDLRRKEKDAPAHYRRYVLNSFEETSDDDTIFSFSELLEAKKKEYAPREGYGHRVMGFDIARYGNDKCAAVGIQQIGALVWRVFHVEEWDHRDLDYSSGRILNIAGTHRTDDNIIDEDGMGAGPLDYITRGRKRSDFKGFRNSGLNERECKDFANPRTKAAFKLKELVSKGHIAIPDEELVQELMTLKYKFQNDGRKILVSKEEMRKKGVKSPNLADALLMAVSLIDRVKEYQSRMYDRTSQRYSKEDDLFRIAGIK